MGNVTWQNYFFKQEAQNLYRKAWYVTVTGDKRFYHVLYFSMLLNVFYFLLQHFLHLWITGRQDVGNTLTAAWCWLKVKSGADWVPAVWSQTHSRLSLAPLARYRPSVDHCSPQTSCVWVTYEPTRWDATRTSCWWMAPLRQPLHRNNTGRSYVWKTGKCPGNLTAVGELTRQQKKVRKKSCQGKLSYAYFKFGAILGCWGPRVTLVKGFFCTVSNSARFRLLVDHCRPVTSCVWYEEM